MNTVNATYTETYDLNTAIGELSMLAVHTPQAGALLRMFHGFFEQYKKYKINGCNIRMVCASQQSLTPDLVGLEAGQVDPRDVLNPILFKACTGEGINVLLDQIYNASQGGPTNGVNSIDQHIDTRPAAERAYYQMLGDDTWRKEHPQRGLSITGLVPMVHKVVTTQPFKWVGHEAVGNIGPKITGSNQSLGSNAAAGFGAPSGTNANEFTGAVNSSVFISNGVTPMPWLDTAILRPVGSRYDIDEAGETDDLIPNTNKPQAYQVINNVPRVYMGCIVLPPAILQRLFFRLQVSWSISFRDWRPSQDVGTLSQYDYIIPDVPFGSQGQFLGSSTVSSSTYWNIYHTASAKAELPTGNLGKEESSFTTNESAEVEQIMDQGA